MSTRGGGPFGPEPDYPAHTSQAVLLAALEQTGILLLRQALPPSDLKTLHWRALQAYTRADTLFSQGQLSPAETMLYHYGHVPPQACYPADNPFLALVELLKPLQGLLNSLLREPVLLYQNSLFRRQTPQSANAPALPWHQDAAFLGPVSPVWNLWCPLVNCGEQAPGLEVLRLNLSQILAPPQLPAGHIIQAGDPYELYAFPDAWLKERYPDTPCWLPQMQVGDLLCFHERILHRTGLLPQMTTARLSLELRVSEAAAAQISDSLVIPLC